MQCSGDLAKAEAAYFFIYDNGNIGNLKADDDLNDAGESKDDERSCEYLIADHLFTCTALQPRP